MNEEQIREGLRKHWSWLKDSSYNEVADFIIAHGHRGEQGGVVIQDEIRVDQSFIDAEIKRYEKMNINFRMGFGSFSGGKEEIIKEIKNLTLVGKEILMMHYRFINSPFYKKIREEMKSER